MLGIDPQFIAFGLIVGILVGLTGIGGGSLMAPLLLLAGGVPPTVAVGTDLAYGAVTKTVGGWRHLRAGTVDLGISKWLAFGSVPGALLGVFASVQLEKAYGDDFDSLLLGAVAAALLLVSVAILYRVWFMPHLNAVETDEVDLTGRTKASAVGFGLVMGAILGLTSVGSGALIGLALILFFRLKPHRVVGTDVFHAAILMWTAAIAHGFADNIDYGLAATLLIGSIPGVLIGTWLLPHVPANGLRPALACVLLAASLGVATKAGADLPPWLIVALPLTAGGLAWVFHRRRVAAELAAAAVSANKPQAA
jgi:uncharacterized membrane protein YfcA